ncbi:MAG: hypothetical protein M1817_001239 [Caeruleum heppii]|nr:MAG: hypothetical protein M1817_001239 [Caeruleum heppii]
MTDSPDAAELEDGNGSSSESGSQSPSESAPVESLIAGREKRATAGNRLSNLLDREADDELELLFAEDEEDIEFAGADDDDQSDIQLESSDDSDDHGIQPGADGDDLEGERELQKQARTERQAKKRKTQDAFFKPPALRKKVKIDPTTATDAPTTPAPRPKKKSERVSWIPDSGEGTTRSSSRRATVQNKEVIHARMKEHEKRRLHQIAVMEAAARRKEDSKPRVMTQADRLAEAERTERQNSKSLNRWEETEKKRSEEQQAKLAALQNRHLDGPVITWWSGLAEWVNGKLTHVGKTITIQGDDTKPHRGKMVIGSKESKASNRETPPEQRISQTGESEARSPGNETIHVIPNGELASNSDNVTTIPSGDGMDIAHAEDTVNLSARVLPPQESRVVERSTRNLLILDNFDPVAVRDREVQRRILFKRRSIKPHKAVQEQCVITSQPAKFRDPLTGLPYSSTYAFREIRKLSRNHCNWSNLLGCYVGPAGVAARGVPERFLSQ